MKGLLRAFVLLALVAFPLSAQDAPISNTSGFMIGVGFNGNAIDGDDFAEVESGGGAHLKLGYGFSPLITGYVSLSGAAIESADGSAFDYTAGQFDVGVRLNFRDETKKARPFLTGGFSGVALVWEDLVGTSDMTSSGTGYHVGGGVGIFFSRKFALDIGFTFLDGTLDEVELDGDTESIDVGIQTTRFDVGANWFLGGNK